MLIYIVLINTLLRKQFSCVAFNFYKIKIFFIKCISSYANVCVTSTSPGTPQQNGVDIPKCLQCLLFQFPMTWVPQYQTCAATPCTAKASPGGSLCLPHTQGFTPTTHSVSTGQRENLDKGLNQSSKTFHSFMGVNSKSLKTSTLTQIFLRVLTKFNNPHLFNSFSLFLLFLRFITGFLTFCYIDWVQFLLNASYSVLFALGCND